MPTSLERVKKVVKIKTEVSDRFTIFVRGIYKTTNDGGYSRELDQAITFYLGVRQRLAEQPNSFPELRREFEKILPGVPTNLPRAVFHPFE